MRQFFPMSRGDLLFIIVLLIFAVVSFLPWSRESSWRGMDMLGWMMAALMVLSPAIALFRLRGQQHRSQSTDGEDAR